MFLIAKNRCVRFFCFCFTSTEHNFLWGCPKSGGGELVEISATLAPLLLSGGGGMVQNNRILICYIVMMDRIKWDKLKLLDFLISEMA